MPFLTRNIHQEYDRELRHYVTNHHINVESSVTQHILFYNVTVCYPSKKKYVFYVIYTFIPGHNIFNRVLKSVC